MRAITCFFGTNILSLGEMPIFSMTKLKVNQQMILMVDRKMKLLKRSSMKMPKGKLLVICINN